jgi:ubiquinone/menaquinone biosynthesis C-methylase UbiE
MSPLDPFRMTDKLDDTLLQVIFTRLEARGKHSFFEKMLQEYLNAMDIDGAKTVLDIGCGTGVAARAIARRPGFVGQVTGVDLSPYLVKAATYLAAQEGVGDRTRFHTGDAHRLDFSDRTFDLVVVHTLLSHVDDPLVVVKEAARVVKPGGMVGIFDGDYASLTFGHADPEQGKAYDEALIKAIVTNPRVMRQMPRYLCAAGLELVASFSYILAEIGRADFWLSGIESFRRLIPKAGTMADEEANGWAESLHKDSEEEVFFGASNYFSYVARRC